MEPFRKIARISGLAVVAGFAVFGAYSALKMAYAHRQHHARLEAVALKFEPFKTQVEEHAKDTDRAIVALNRKLAEVKEEVAKAQAPAPPVAAAPTSEEAQPAPAEDDTIVYTVTDDDTIVAIARRHGVDGAEISPWFAKVRELNKSSAVKDWNKIWGGLKITIPAPADPEAPTRYAAAHRKK